MILIRAVFTLHRDLDGAAALGYILHIRIHLNTAQHIAHCKLCACQLFIGLKA